MLVAIRDGSLKLPLPCNISCASQVSELPVLVSPVHDGVDQAVEAGTEEEYVLEGRGRLEMDDRVSTGPFVFGQRGSLAK